jgi:hypothetical protein
MIRSRKRGSNPQPQARVWEAEIEMKNNQKEKLLLKIFD